MSAIEPDPNLVPDLVSIGESPEWKAWLDEATAYFEDRWPGGFDWGSQKLSMGGIREDSIPQILVHDERTHIRHDLVPLVRASVRDYSISRHPWGFTP